MPSNVSIDEFRQSDPFVGREKELGLLRGHLRNVSDYKGKFVLIRGEVGVGKTRFLNEFAGNITSPDTQILQGIVMKDDINPYAPFARMIEDYLDRLENRRLQLLKLLPPEIATYLLQLMPRIINRYPLDTAQIDQSTSSEQLLYSFDYFYSNLSRYRITVLILDDIMWMRPDGIELLKYLVRRISNHPILFLATICIDHENPVLNQAIQELDATHLIEVVNLSNLSAEETEELVQKKFRKDVPNYFLHWIFSKTRGNALFIREIMLSLYRQNIIYYDEGKDTWMIRDDYSDFPVSEAVENIIKYRIGKLKEFELRLLQTAAVIGERFHVKILEKLIGIVSKNKFKRSINILTNAKLIQGTGDMRTFAHPLIRDVLEQQFDQNRRRTIHRRLAKILRQMSGSEEEIASHLTKDLAPDEETPALARYLFKVSRILLDRYNYHQAWNYLKMAERILPRIPGVDIERLRIESRLNWLSWIMVRDVISISDALRFARKLEKAELKSEAAVQYEVLFNRYIAAMDLGAANRCLKKAIAFAKRNDAIYWTLMADQLLLLKRKGMFKKAIEEAENLVTRISRHKVPVAYCQALNSIGMVAVLNGDYVSARQSFSRVLEVAREYNLISNVEESYRNLGLAELETGELDSALSHLHESLKIAKMLQLETSASVDQFYTAICFMHRGEFDKAIQIFDRVIATATESKYPRLKATVLVSKARAYLDSGDMRSAEELITTIPVNDLDMGGRYDLEFLKIELSLMQNRIPHALEAIDKILPRLRRLKLKSRYGRVLGEKAIILAQQGKKEKALRYFNDAKAMLSAQGKLPHLSHLIIDFGLCLNGPPAEEMIIDGLKILMEMGADARLRRLYPIMEKKGFDKCCQFLEEYVLQSKTKRIIISTFGGLHVKRPEYFVEATKKEWPSRKSQEVLGLLLLAPERGSTREALASILWPEVTKSKQQLNFRVALAHLKKMFGEPIVQQGQFIRIDREIAEVDFLTFEAHCYKWQDLKRKGKFHGAEESARNAIALYKDDFLPEFYSQPILSKNGELKEKMQDLLHWLADKCIERLEYEEAISLARRLLSFDSLDEQAHQTIMEGLFYQDDRAGALRQFELLKRNLKEELNAEPSPKTMELYRRIVSAG